MNATYLRFEFLRLLRNRRFFIFSIGIPVALFITIGRSNKHQSIDLGHLSIGFPLYYMVGMAGYGAMIGAMAGGARIAAERGVGWNRQLRLTPLSVGSYFTTKVITGYAMAMMSIVLIYLCGSAYGVRLPAERWLEMTGLILVSLIPFLALGILVGHLLTVDSIGPALGGGASAFGFLGGQWFPLPNSGALHQIGQLVPSYWMTQASHVGIGAGAWPVKGWIVIAVWSVVVALLAARAYQRDTQRV